MGHFDEAYLLRNFYDALRQGYIRPFFQPVYRSVTGKILGAEALARWIDPEKGMLSPDEFIPVLERTGQIYDLDMAILQQTCALYQKLQYCGIPLNSFSVNLSRHDFQHEDLFDRVISIVDEHETPHDAIKLEITESLMIDDAETFRNVIRKFHHAGFSIWLDDFGSGYSSLNVLQNYQFDVMKFDMLFLRDNTSRGRQLLASLISMAKALRIHTLTEGVETEEQRQFLISAGCEAQQGFYYAKPVPEAELIDLIKRQEELPESPEEKRYWDEIGRLNFLSPNPLKEFTEGIVEGTAGEITEGTAEGGGTSFKIQDSSIALVACSTDQFKYMYASEGYRNRIRELGFEAVGGLEKALSNQRSHIFLMIRKLVLDAIKQNKEQIFEYVYKDVYFRLSLLCIAKMKGQVMMAMRLSTFDSEQEVKTAQEMLNYSSALLSTYELVVLFYLDSKVVKRIYAASDMPVYDRESSIQESLRKFCEAEVEPVDQARYMAFMDLETMTERVESSPRQFIQSVFRMRWSQDENNWYTARVTQIPTFSEKVHMLTIQNIQGNVNQWLDMVIQEHPELL